MTTPSETTPRDMTQAEFITALLDEMFKPYGPHRFLSYKPGTNPNKLYDAICSGTTVQRLLTITHIIASREDYERQRMSASNAP